MLLTFTPFSNGIDKEKVHINPNHVVFVLERELRPSGAFNQKVAVIQLVTGEDQVVYDHDRTVAKQLLEAQS